MTTQPPSHRALSEFHKGVNFGFTARNGYYDSPEARLEIDKMVESGVGWVGLTISVWQDTYSSTKVYADYERTPNEAELERIINRIKSKGIRVMLYLCLECFDGRWRGDVRFPKDLMRFSTGTPDYAKLWFESYTKCCLAYSRLAARTGVEMICLGAEYAALQSHETEWSALIDEVREVYDGAISYEVWVPHHLLGTDQIKDHPDFTRDWYRKLDLIGFSYYAKGSDKPGATKEEMKQHLQASLENLRKVAAVAGRPVIFTECGCRSRHGGATSPADYQRLGNYDGEEQANYLQAVIETFQDEPWWFGLYWWKWEEQNKEARAHYYTDPVGGMGFEMHGKPAGEVYKNWTVKKQPTAQ